MGDDELIPRVPEYAQKGTRRFVRIRICILLTGLSLFAQLYIYQPLIEELHSSFGVLSSTASLAVSSGTIGMALGLFFYVFYADVLPRRRLMTLTRQSNHPAMSPENTRPLIPPRMLPAR